MAGERQTRDRSTFYTIYDDVDDRLHINRRGSNQHLTPKSGWRESSSSTEKDWLVCTREEFAQLVADGLSALSYQVERVRAGGVRIDGRDETVYALNPITVKSEERS